MDKESDEYQIFRFVPTPSDHVDIHNVARRHLAARTMHTKSDSKTGNMSDNNIDLIDVVPTHPLILLGEAGSAELSENDSSHPNTPVVGSVHASKGRTKEEDPS